MESETSKTENILRNGFFQKFNKDVNNASKQFAKASNRFLKSKEYKAMIESFKKIG
ncbi:hypothetical protein [Roseivirga pacifica]|uniref:hypothetical protein n=1 Tax=Roseivirga pacifica TaxID=1267423 RepID=UPI002095DE93|nr:hypothetical protein [Roseivirga pacifica]